MSGLLIFISFQISKCCVLVSHSACIWDVKNLPSKDLNMAGSVYTDKINCHEVSFATMFNRWHNKAVGSCCIGLFRRSVREEEVIACESTKAQHCR